MKIDSEKILDMIQDFLNHKFKHEYRDKNTILTISDKNVKPSEYFGRIFDMVCGRIHRYRCGTCDHEFPDYEKSCILDCPRCSENGHLIECDNCETRRSQNMLNYGEIDRFSEICNECLEFSNFEVADYLN